MAPVVKALEKGATIEEAAAEAGFARTTLYEWRERSELFREAWDDAVRESSRPMLVVSSGQRRYQLQRMRRNAFDRERQKVFPGHFAATCDAKASAEEPGVALSTVKNKRLDDPAFADGWQRAVEQGYALLEAAHLAQRLKAAERILFSGAKEVPDAADEFERGLRLLKEYKRVAGGPKTGRPPTKASVEEGFAELERELLAYKARRERQRLERDGHGPDCGEE